ncbi:Pentatricopeptide repeat-containing protein [Hibiscus syriacus]|uniref:Pentatricopeptide repeat-containing protein n=1 Tax=Hibiscus syriacus TaxID=106335 RepID=A0A6A2YCU3_HIBSY|nr:pentatricopeptide repeat-containing protein At3g24000, mitochondrial-like [Hibiscus syriacus]KAE8669654.1 Pentatricopeptide repeat-containing protein [Hibiscus syriacus]
MNFITRKFKCKRIVVFSLLSVTQSASRFSTAAVASDGPQILEPFSSGIIQDKDLLVKSLHPSGTGLHVLDLLDEGSLEPNPTLYHVLLKKCTFLRKPKLGKIVHAHILNSPFRADAIILNTLLNMYAKCGCLEDARSLFDEMPVRNMVTWTTLITAYSQHDRPFDAILLFPQMLSLGLFPNEFTLSSLLKASAALSEVTRIYFHGTQLHGFSFKCGFHSNVYVGSSLLDMYARCGCMDESHFLFDVLTTKNEVSWNALIAGHARKGQVDHALCLFLKMLRHDFQPTHFTFSSIFGACAYTGSLEQGKWVHAHMIKSGGEIIAFMGNTLLHMYAKSGSIQDAKMIFDRLTKRDLVSWNSMLTAYAQHGLGKEALQFFQEILTVGLAPNDITFLCLLTACSRAGLLDEGRYYFKLMRKYNIEPGISHYVTIVDLLGRAGLLDEAKRFINEIPIQPTAAVWGALLGACRMHKNMEMGSFAAERVFELDPSDSGPHVLLSNIYASGDRWRDAAKVRKLMKDSGVKKEPACSWVEIQNTVHMFVANDDSHLQMEAIHKKWEEISTRIKEIGYVPDTSHVLFYMDHQEREVKLQYHSEKLALAFALLNSPPGSTIRIKKNIRVCGDCHSAFKFASRVVKREIIVRDTNRFHHFYDGSCSCGDYW